MTDVNQTRTLFINGMDLADSFKKGSFKQSCPHPTAYKAVRSNLKITAKQKPCFQIRGEQKGLQQKDIDKS